MRWRNFLLWIGLGFVCLSCSWLGWGEGEKKQVQEPPPPVLEEGPGYLKSSRIVQPLLLERGGKLLLRPFNAGAGVESTDELDQIGMRLIRGILDVQEGLFPTDDTRKELDPKRFDVGLDEEEQKADFILKGRITEVHRTSSWKKWVLFKIKKRLAVEGQLVDKKTNTTVVVFKDELMTDDPEKTHRDLGQDIGRKIGQLIFKK